MAKNESLRTSGFMGLAVVAAASAALTYWINRPPKIDGFELVGQQFFEKFTDSSQATSLKVVAMTPDAKMQEFSVKRVDGLWIIPSHNNYPAEAVERLAATSASVIGLEREALVGRLASEHEKFGVIDPTSDEAMDPETTGKRLTLVDHDDNVLADLIIGKQAERIETDRSAETFEADRPTNYFYVRRADEPQTYKVPLRVELSTKFSDWIDTDLLRLDPNELTRINLDNYELQESAGDILGQTKQLSKIDGEKISMSLDATTPDANWAMDGLNVDQEAINMQGLVDVAKTLKDLRIVGVRPKTTFNGKQVLTADLQINTDPEIRANPVGFEKAIAQLRFEMSDKGFNLLAKRTPTGQNELFFLCKKGELEFGTSQGVNYTLMLGNRVTDGQKAIDLGGNQSEEGSEPAAKTDLAQSAGDTDRRDRRYIVIRVNFDETLLGPKPAAPTPPAQPIALAGYTTPVESPAENSVQVDQNDAPKPGEIDLVQNIDSGAVKRSAEFLAHDKALEEYESAKVEYELALARYEDEMKVWNEKVAQGKKLANEHHERFGKWYYIVSADNLEKIQAKRSDLVTKTEPPTKVELPNAPDISFEIDESLLNQNETEPVTDSVKDSDPAKKETETNQD